VLPPCACSFWALIATCRRNGAALPVMSIISSATIRRAGTLTCRRSAIAYSDLYAGSTCAGTRHQLKGTICRAQPDPRSSAALSARDP
jgi:hypothetical protein